ncbi:MAG: ADP-ribosylglycohydrolase family protein [Acidobacteriota bacterium]
MPYPRCWSSHSASRPAAPPDSRWPSGLHLNVDRQVRSWWCSLAGRLARVPMFYFPDQAAAIRYSGESSRPTHGADECIDACRLLGGMIYRALGGGSKQAVPLADAEAFQGLASARLRQTRCGSRGASTERQRDSTVNCGWRGKMAYEQLDEAGRSDHGPPARCPRLPLHRGVVRTESSVPESGACT